MTTPNIKALAEQIKAEHEQNHNAAWSVGHEYYFENYPEYSLASALLRVMEDARNLSEALRHINECKLDVSDNWADEALESHKKLMEELNENIKP